MIGESAWPESWARERGSGALLWLRKNEVEGPGGSEVADGFQCRGSLVSSYHVTSSRTLTSIEQAIDVSGTSQFTWYVYEHSLPTGTYTRIFEKLTGGSGAGPHGSGPLEVPLVAGRYYVIGVRVIGPHDAYRASGATPTWLSFGQFRTSRETSSTLGATYSLTTTMSGSQYGQRLTTAAP